MRHPIRIEFTREVLLVKFVGSSSSENIFSKVFVIILKNGEIL